MPIAVIPAKTVNQSRYNRALFWGNLFANLITAPEFVISSLWERTVLILSKSHYGFEIFGQVRLLLSFVGGLFKVIRKKSELALH